MIAGFSALSCAGVYAERANEKNVATYCITLWLSISLNQGENDVKAYTILKWHFQLC